jgi:hypothetical protein
MMAAGHAHPETLDLEQMTELFKTKVRIRFSAQEPLQCFLNAHRFAESISVSAVSQLQIHIRHGTE